MLGALSRRARALPPAVLEECRATSELLGPAYVTFFETALVHAWGGAGGDDVASGRGSRPARPNASAGEAAASYETPLPSTSSPPASRPSPARALVHHAAAAVAATEAFAVLAQRMAGFEHRPEQMELATAVGETFDAGGVLVAEAGTGTGKSLAYLVPALRRAAMGERVIVSTHALPLQDQLVRKDLPALQAALGTEIPVAILKGRSNYLCPRRWQVFRTSAATAEEARLALKTLVWRITTEAGDRAELNLMRGEAALWPRVSADDETCTGRRCAAVRGGCYLQRARARAE